MTYALTSSLVTASSQEVTTHYVAICKQIEMLDRVIREAHNELHAARSNAVKLELLAVCENSWRLRRQLCDDREATRKTFYKEVEHDARATALQDAERKYR